MDKTKKSSKMLANFLVDFLPILYQKVKNYFGLSIRHPIATIDVTQKNVTALKVFFGHYSTIQITVCTVALCPTPQLGPLSLCFTGQQWPIKRYSLNRND